MLKASGEIEVSRFVVWLLAGLGSWLLAFWGAVALVERPLATGALMTLAFFAGFVVRDRICFRKCPCYPRPEG